MPPPALVIQDGHLGVLGAVAFSPDGKWLAWGGCAKGDCPQSSIKLWDIAGGKLHATLAGHDSAIRLLRFTPDSKRLLSGSSGFPVILWDVRTGQRLAAVESTQGVVDALAFSPDGERMAAGYEHGSHGHGTIELWDVAAGKLLVDWQGYPCPAIGLAFSPDGRQLASAGFEHDAPGDDCLKVTVKLWDSNSGQLIAGLESHAIWLTALAFSSDGRQLAAGGCDGEGCRSSALRLWDLSNHYLQRNLPGHPNPVSAIAFSADGRYLASASEGGEVKLWDMSASPPSGATYPLLATWATHQGEVNGLAFSPDGRRLASAGHDGTLLLWDTQPPAPLLALLPLDQVDWVVHAADGRVDVSPGGARHLSWKSGPQIYDFQQFRRQLVVPGLWTSLWNRPPAASPPRGGP